MNLILDFDSTIIQGEGLDILAEVCLGKKSNQVDLVKDYTVKGMSGEIPMDESLTKRIELLRAKVDDINETVIRLKEILSPSIKYLFDSRGLNLKDIYVVSGGFLEYVLPICTSLGVLDTHVFANKFIYDDNNIVGFDKTLPLWKAKGKVALMKSLNLENPIYMVGDGYTDLEVKLHGNVKRFIAYTETIHRDSVVSEADYVCSNFKEVLNILKSEEGI